MFGYIYAEGRYGNIHHFVASKTEAGIKRAAFEYITNLAHAHGEPGCTGDLGAVYAAIKAEDIKQAISSWNHYSAESLKRPISCHRVEPIAFTD